MFTISDFNKRFPSEESCLDEIRRLRFPKGISCTRCKKITRHYKVQGRTAYTCKYCRHHVYPLAGTIFKKSTTSLRLWLYALFLITQTEGKISAKDLQRQLGATYKTAWRIKSLLVKNNEDILASINEQEKIHKWLFFNKFEFKVSERQQSFD